MNKKITIVFAFILAIALLLPAASAAMNGNGNPENSAMAENGAQDTDMPITAYRNREQIKLRTFSTVEGKEVNVRVEGLLRPEIKVGNSVARCEKDCILESEELDGETKIFVKNSNGLDREIKIMPDTASFKALEKLRIRNCNESTGCKIELKQTGEGNQSRLAYGVTLQKRAKVFGLFATKMRVGADVDAESGEVIRTRKPWWAFLASESSEEPEAIDTLLE